MILEDILNDIDTLNGFLDDFTGNVDVVDLHVEDPIRNKILDYIKNNSETKQILSKCLKKYYVEDEVTQDEIDSGHVRLGKDLVPLSSIISNEIDERSDTVFKTMYEMLVDLLNNQDIVNETYPFYNPYSYFENMYSVIFSTWKKNPSMYNRGKLDGFYEAMRNFLGNSKANTIHNRALTKYSMNKPYS